MRLSRALPVALFLVLLGWGAVDAAYRPSRERQPSLQEQAQYLGNEDYFEAHGGTPRSYIVALYADVLQRAPSEAEIERWTADLQSCGNGEILAQDFLIFANSELTERAQMLPLPVLEPAGCRPPFQESYRPRVPNCPSW